MGEFDGGCGLSDAFQAVHTAMHRADDVAQTGETVRDFSGRNSFVCCRVWSVVYVTTFRLFNTHLSTRPDDD